MSVISKGMSHKCNHTSKFQNIMGALNSDDGLLKEQVAAACLRDLSVNGGGDIPLSNNHGKPTIASITVKKSRSVNRFTCKDLVKIQTDIQLSDNNLVSFVSQIRATFGRKSVEPHLKEYLVELNSYLKPYFTSSTITMEYNESLDDKSKKLVHVERPVYYCKDVDVFVKLLINYRSLNPHETLVKIGLDGGGGSLKITLNIIDMSKKRDDDVVLGKRRKYNDGVKTNTGIDTSVKKTYILLIVPDVPETYNNLKVLLDMIDIDTVQFVIACDLKLCNILLGLQGHTSTHCCLYCESQKPWLQTAPTRTLKSLNQSYRAYVDNGCIIKNAAKYGNVVNKPLFCDNEDTAIMDIIPPMELHLFLGPVNLLFSYITAILGKDVFKDFLISNNIVRKAYNGGGFEGNQCSKLLDLVDHIEQKFSNIKLAPYIKALRCFKKVVDSCYSFELRSSFREDIIKFKAAYLELDIPITPKLHIIFDHITPFCESHGKSLGIFSEQATESIHADFNKFWQKYKVTNIENESYRPALELAATAYNSKHLI